MAVCLRYSLQIVIKADGDHGYVVLAASTKEMSENLIPPWN